MAQARDVSTGIDLTVEYLPRLPKNPFVGIGCVGAGFIMADCHLVAYRNAGFNPVAIASQDPRKARNVAARHRIPGAYNHYTEVLEDRRVEVLDVAVPPDVQFEIIQAACEHRDHIRGILAQKPLGMDYGEAREIVAMCEQAGITLAVNQNMRFDHSVRACKWALDRGHLGDPVLGTIEMRAIPHWMPWQQRLGWVTLRIMSIHHLDTFRYWFGNPTRVYASTRPDPRTRPGAQPVRPERLCRWSGCAREARDGAGNGRQARNFSLTLRGQGRLLRAHARSRRTRSRSPRRLFDVHSAARRASPVKVHVETPVIGTVDSVLPQATGGRACPVHRRFIASLHLPRR